MRATGSRTTVAGVARSWMRFSHGQTGARTEQNPAFFS